MWKGHYTLGDANFARAARITRLFCSWLQLSTSCLLQPSDPASRYHLLVGPDLFCDVCNRATAEVSQLLLPEVLEDATPVSPLASTGPVTMSSCTVSPAFSAVLPGDLIPASLSEPSPHLPVIMQGCNYQEMGITGTFLEACLT